MKRNVIIIFALLVLACSLSAKPQETYSDIYVSGAVGYANTGWDDANYDSTGFGFNLMAGYRLNNTWSFDGGYTHFPKATKATGSISTNALSGFAKLRLPFNLKNLNFYTKAGFGNLFTSGDVNNSHFGLAVAYGVDYLFKPELNFEAQYTHYVGSYSSNIVPNADFYSLGVVYFLPQHIFS